MNTAKSFAPPMLEARSHPFRSLFFAVAGALILTGFIVPRANAVGQLVTYFNFEDQPIGPTVDFTSDQPPGTQASTLSVISNITPTTVTGLGATNRAPGDLDTSTDRGLGFANTLTNNPATIQFTVSTINLSGLSLSFANHDHGDGYDLVQGFYSINGGAFVAVTPTPVALLEGINTITYSSAVNNQSSVTFRFVLSGIELASEPNRRTTIDNIQLNAAVAVPEPATVAGGVLGVFGLFWHQRRRLFGLLRLRPA